MITEKVTIDEIQQEMRKLGLAVVDLKRATKAESKSAIAFDVMRWASNINRLAYLYGQGK